MFETKKGFHVFFVLFKFIREQNRFPGTSDDELKINELESLDHKKEAFKEHLLCFPLSILNWE